MNRVIFFTSTNTLSGTSASVSQVQLTRGQLLDFEQAAQGLFEGDVQLWLVDDNWQALAEVSVMTQQICGEHVTGKLRIDYIYEEQEQALISQMLVRMYASRVDPYIYFLIGEQEYHQAKIAGQLVRDSLHSEGFLHACPKQQLERLAKKHYSKVDNLKVMMVAVDKLEGVLKWEPATGGLYPHLFAPLNMDSVVDVMAFEQML